MKYYIDYNTGAGNEWGDTLEDAQRIADAGASYTQCPIVITDEDGNEVSRRNWWGLAYDENEVPEENPIRFGNFGYYSDWQS